MESLLYLIILIVVFAALVWGAFWICDKAGFPPPVKLVVALVFLLILLFAAVRMFDDGDIGAPRIEIRE